MGLVRNHNTSAYSLMDGADLVGNISTPGHNAKGYMVGFNHEF